MADIPASVITQISSLAVSPHDTSLRLVDYWVEAGGSYATGSTIPAANLGVSKIRGVLGFMALDGGAWVPDSATDYIDAACEKRARDAAYGSGSAQTFPAVADDADYLTVTTAAARDGFWFQLLVES